MVGERNRQRPRVEGLESRALLSGLGPAAERAQTHAAQNHASSQHGKSITFDGSVQGTFSDFQFATPPSVYHSIRTEGSLGTLGITEVVGAFTAAGLDLTQGATGSLHLVNAEGTLTLQITQTSPTAAGGKAGRGTEATPSNGPETGLMTFHYTVEDATGPYQGDHGSGTVTMELTPGGLPGPGLTGVGNVVVQFRGGAA